MLLLLSALVLALAGCTGRSLIAWNSGWSPTATASSGDDVVVFVGTRQGEILALDANAGGAVIWRFAPEGERQLSAYRYARGGWGFHIRGRYREQGRRGREAVRSKERRESNSDTRRDLKEWVRPTAEGDIRAIVGGPALADGLVLVGSDDGNLYAFRAAVTTRVRWPGTFPRMGKSGLPRRSRTVWYTSALWTTISTLSIRQVIRLARKRGGTRPMERWSPNPASG